ncbi:MULTISPECIES: hypothetical protein [unclassified Pseudomonas]|jgi:hypothetical protein|uniref:hypothetical protein n=1 Tax=Pseudomonas sp. A-R-26 TaxID=2832404 RepID=UPI001CBD1602|nr:hypothetical protein [Pseudomonas sp. A-R-26]
MVDINDYSVAQVAFDDAMQDKYFEGIAAELKNVAPRARTKRSTSILGAAPSDSSAQGVGDSVVGPSLVVFDQALSEDDRQDALDCQQFAEAQVRSLPKEASNEERYLKYNEALLAVGWVTGGFTYKKYVSKQLTITMNEAILQVLETVISGGASSVLNLVASGFSKLRGDKDALKIVDVGSRKNDVVSFKAVPCIATPGGGMSMLLGGLDLVDKEYNGDFLFVTYKTQGLQIFQGAGVRKFNRRAFERKKNMVYAYNDQFADGLFKQLTDQ